MYFVVFGTDKPGKLALREETRPAHRAHARNPEGHAVKLILGGPTLGEDGAEMNGTLLIVEARTIEAVRAYVADDPYSKVGLFADVQIRPWNWGTGRPGPA